jgi:ornithine carbamoyltransferase
MSEPRHFLDLIDIPRRELRAIIEASRAMKKRGRGTRAKPLAGRMLAMIFDKPSTRTRVSFDVAMRQLGGDVILLTGHDMQLGRGETIADTAQVLSRYVDAIMIRTLDHAMLLELAQHATVPVINGLTRRSHPCQVMADVMTFEEHRGPIKGKTVAWTDANNVPRGCAAQRFVRAAVGAADSPRRSCRLGQVVGRRHPPRPRSSSREGAPVACHRHLVSMGAGQLRPTTCKPTRSTRLMARARPDACSLPAGPPREVTDEVIDGPQSECSTGKTACAQRASDVVLPRRRRDHLEFRAPRRGGLRKRPGQADSQFSRFRTDPG